MFFLSLLFSFSILADARIALPGIHPNGIAPSTNGAFWMSPSLYSNEIALVQADGSFERVKIEAPLPFGNDRHAPMLGLRDGSLVVASFNGMLAHVRTNLEYTVYRLPDPAPLLITDLALGAEARSGTPRTGIRSESW